MLHDICLSDRRARHHDIQQSFDLVSVINVDTFLERSKIDRVFTNQPTLLTMSMNAYETVFHVQSSFILIPVPDEQILPNTSIF